MSKLPWIEKYRPQSFSNVISHTSTINILKNFIKNKQVPHMIFHGPPGTGKTSIMMSFAKELYGEDMELYVLIINASEERGIDVTRNKISSFVKNKSLNMSENTDHTMFKLIILDEADAMTPDAQSSLRRIIEQYTDSTRFCFICNYIKNINIALQSRCVVFQFPSLLDSEILVKIKEIVKKENINITKQGITQIIKRANGDMRKILNILQTVWMIYPDKEIDADTINRYTRSPLQKDINDIIDHLLTKTYEETYKFITDLKITYGYSFDHIITDLAMYLFSILDGTTNHNKLDKEQTIKICSLLSDIQYNSTTVEDETAVLALIGIFKI